MTPPPPGHPLLLAQLSRFLAPEIPPLPSPPFFERALLESPATLAAGAVILGVIAVAACVARGRARWAWLSVIAAALAVVSLFALSAAVTTPRERLAALTRLLVASAAAADAPALRPLFSDAGVIDVPMVGLNEVPASTLLDAAALGRWFNQAGGLRDHGIPEIQAVIDGPNSARTQVAVWGETSQGRNGSWWRIDWYRPDPDRPWVAARVRCLWLQGFGS